MVKRKWLYDTHWDSLLKAERRDEQQRNRKRTSRITEHRYLKLRRDG